MDKKKVVADSNSLIVEVTSGCNFNCPFCFNSSSSHTPTYLTLANVESIIQNIQHCGIKNIGISGGEPLLHPDIEKILSRFSIAGFSVRLITNGFLINNQLLDWFLEHDAVLQLSMDGADQFTHDHYRQEGSYLKNIQTMEYLHKRNYTRGILRMTITKNNYMQVTDFYHLCQKYDFYPSYSVVQTLGDALDDWSNLSLSISEYENVQQQLSLLCKTDSKMLQQVSNTKIIGYCPLLYGSVISAKPIVDSNGNVYPCHCLRDAQFRLGNCLNNSLDSILSTMDKEFTDKIIEMLDEIHDPACNNCFLSKSDRCHKGCPGLILSAPSKEIEKMCYILKRSCLKKHIKKNKERDLHE